MIDDIVSFIEHTKNTRSNIPALLIVEFAHNSLEEETD